MPSYYFPGLASLKPGDFTQLDGAEYHHLRVTHRRSKEPILLNSGEGHLAKAEVTGQDGKSAQLKILELKTFPRPTQEYAIAFSLLKNRNDEMLIEKCTELGVIEIFPMITEHSVMQASASTLSRFAKVALAAIKQCDNPWLPLIHAPLGLAQALIEIRKRGFVPIVSSERKPGQWLHHLDLEPGIRPCFLIGPEGGWSDSDFQQMGELEQISLGSLITRAETAAIAVSAQWLAYANKASSS